MQFGSRSVRVMRVAATAIVAMAALAWFYRFQIGDGFALTFGDRYDAMIEVAILQHWANVLAGTETWNNTTYFHPAAETLGYNDGYLVYGLLYALARAIGLPLVAAADAVHAAMKLAGFVGMMWLLQVAGRCRIGWRLFGAFLFTIADITLQHANHGQLFTLAFAPFALALAWRIGEALVAAQPRALTRYGCGFVAVYALWVSTSFYLAWFFAVYGAAAAMAVICLSAEPGRRAIYAGLRTSAPQLAIVGLIGLMLIAPFLSVYLPKRAETGMHRYEEVLPSTFAPFDYVNVGVGNLAWSGPLGWVRGSIAPGLAIDHDRVFGLAPLLSGLTLLLTIRFARDRRLPGLGALGIATLVAWLSMLRIGNFSVWQFVYDWVPGAPAIRVVGRFELVLLVPIVVLATVWLDRWRRPRLALVLAAALLVEQVGLSAPLALDQAEQLAMIAAVPTPPPACRSFFVVSARHRPRPVEDLVHDPNYAHNVDAMVLSETLRRPTINGVSTFEPPYWDFGRPFAPDYDARVRRYVVATRIAPPCRLDMRAGGWSLSGS